MIRLRRAAALLLLLPALLGHEASGLQPNSLTRRSGSVAIRRSRNTCERPSA